MPGQGRLGDKAQVPIDAHGCPACPHPGTGPAIQGSPDVFVNRRPALRVNDPGIHAACCGLNTWQAQRGCETVFINGQSAFRLLDPSKHCGGQGQLIEGSPNVIVGNMGNAPGAAPGGAPRSASAAGGHSAGSSPGAAAAASEAAASEAAASETGGGAAGSPSGSAGGTRDGAPGPAAAAGVAAATTGDAAAPPASPPDAAGPDNTFVEIELVGEDGSPIAGERFELTTPDGELHTGYTDDRGLARAVAAQPGACTVSFPDLDRDAWVQL